MTHLCDLIYCHNKTQSQKCENVCTNLSANVINHSQQMGGSGICLSHCKHRTLCYRFVPKFKVQMAVKMARLRAQNSSVRILALALGGREVQGVFPVGWGGIFLSLEVRVKSACLLSVSECPYLTLIRRSILNHSGWT